MAKKEAPAYLDRDFFRELAAGKLYSCYCLEGEEELVKESALKKLRETVLSGPMRELNETILTDPDADTLIAAAETLPLMAEKRLLIVKESHLLVSARAGEGETDDSAERLSQYLQRSPATTVVVFWVRGAADKRKRLYKTIREGMSAGRSVIVTFERQSESTLRSWMIRRCRENQVTLSDEMAVQIIFRTGDSLMRIQGEIDKLCAYVGPGGTVDEAALDAIITQNIEYRVYDLSRAVLSGDGARAFSMLEALLTEGEERLGLLALLGGQCRQLHKVAVLAQAGERDSDIMRILGLPDFVVRQTRALARRFSMEEISAMPALCLQTEYAMKSGQMPMEGGLEKVMLDILAMGGNHGNTEQPARR